MSLQRKMASLALGLSMLPLVAGMAVADPMHDHYGAWMRNHPQVAAELYQHREYLWDRHYLATHPEVQSFLVANPGFVNVFAANPVAFYPVGYNPTQVSLGYSNGNFSVGVNVGGGPVYAPPPAYAPVPVYAPPVGVVQIVAPQPYFVGYSQGYYWQNGRYYDGRAWNTWDYNQHRVMSSAPGAPPRGWQPPPPQQQQHDGWHHEHDGDNHY